VCSAAEDVELFHEHFVDAIEDRVCGASPASELHGGAPDDEGGQEDEKLVGGHAGREEKCPFLPWGNGGECRAREDKWR